MRIGIILAALAMLLLACDGTVINIGGVVNLQQSTDGAEIRADAATVDQTDGGTTLGPPVNGSEDSSETPSLTESPATNLPPETTP